MAEVTAFRKNKVELHEYDYLKDVHNRSLMAQFTPTDLEVMEEILYSSIRISLTSLQQQVGLSSSHLESILNRLALTGLFTTTEGALIVDKEARKYYELQILKFQEDFHPGIDYLQGLLRKVPIHVLPNWYAIPRGSNNIFESIIERYFHTPYLFQRHLSDLQLEDPVEKGIVSSLYCSPSLTLEAQEIIDRFHLSQEDFEKHMLHLEFNFACCSKFERKGDRFVQIIAPFQEWHHYLHAIKNRVPSSIVHISEINRLKESDFAVIEEMEALLKLASQSPISTEMGEAIQKSCLDFDLKDYTYYAEKLCSVGLAELRNNKLSCTPQGYGWLKLDSMSKSAALHRLPSNSIDHPDLPDGFSQQRIIREAEKSVDRVAHLGWIYVDDFIESISVALKEEHAITLKRHGRFWKYELPHYNEAEKLFFLLIVSRWLFDLGITALGRHRERLCFCLTPFGQGLFSNE